MNINFKESNSIHLTSKGNDKMPEKSIGQLQKDTVNKIYKRACCEMTQDGDFDKIIEEFVNPTTKDIYTMEITHCQAPNESQKRYLTLGCEIPNSPNKLCFSVTSGTKQDILDYLGNESNLDEIAAYYKMLNRKVNDM